MFGPGHAQDVGLLRGNSVNRQIRLFDGVEPAAVYAEHQANLGRYAAIHGGAPIVHESMAQVVDLWQRGADHEVRTFIRVCWVSVPAAILCFVALMGISAAVTDSLAERTLPVTAFTIFLVKAIWAVLGTFICGACSIVVWSVLARSMRIRPKFE